MSSDRPITPYAPFTDVPRSVTPLSVQAVSEPPPSTRASTFTREVIDALALVEQSITENVKRALQALGSAVLAKQDETRRLVMARDVRLDAHAAELRALRGAIDGRLGVILPPPPDGL